MASSSSSGWKNSTTNKSSSKTPCCTKVGLKRGPWTPDEDEILSNYVQKEGEGRWRTLPKRAGLLRCGKSCRLRWMNYLRPSVKRGQIGEDEEDLILRLHRLLGNRWSLIAGRIPGRTDNEIKNYWNTHLSKKLISQGIDPRTHKPLTNPNPNNHYHEPPPLLFEPTSISNPKFIHPGHDDSSTSAISSLEMSFSEAIDDKGNDNNRHEYLKGITTLNADQNHYNLENSDGFIMGFRDMEEDLHHHTEFNNDDVFSSFFNSLINDDVYVHQHQQPQQHPTTAKNQVPLLDCTTPVDSSSTQSFGYSDVIMESAYSSPNITNINAFNQEMLG
ncbi:hypothetical protein MKX03_012190 [Papaver bracteatum]|nr:hypothetical protein MKX03_012190 [Papaver bracteatum]